ncbi:MAG: hypothetical protein IH595_00015 [Bacteroidales bacterium]|nr:hypothetical protein [Bacteroidales bacterium]
MPVQNYYTSHKSQHGPKVDISNGAEASEMKPSPTIVRNLMAYAATLSIIKTRTIGNLTIILN